MTSLVAFANRRCRQCFAAIETPSCCTPWAVEPPAPPGRDEFVIAHVTSHRPEGLPGAVLDALTAPAPCRHPAEDRAWSACRMHIDKSVWCWPVRMHRLGVDDDARQDRAMALTRGFVVELTDDPLALRGDLLADGWPRPLPDVRALGERVLAAAERASGRLDGVALVGPDALVAPLAAGLRGLGVRTARAPDAPSAMRWLVGDHRPAPWPGEPSPDATVVDIGGATARAWLGALHADAPPGPPPGLIRRWLARPGGVRLLNAVPADGGAADPSALTPWRGRFASRWSRPFEARFAAAEALDAPATLVIGLGPDLALGQGQVAELFAWRRVGAARVAATLVRAETAPQLVEWTRRAFPRAPAIRVDGRSPTDVAVDVALSMHSRGRR